MKKINFVLVLTVLILSVYTFLPQDANAYCGDGAQQANACRTSNGGNDGRYNGRNNNVEKYRDKENRNVVNVRKPAAQSPNSGALCH